MRQEIHEIICDSCCEVAVEYDTNVTCASALDGQARVCKSCSMIGTIQFDYEHQRASVGFFQVSPSRLPCVDFGIILEGYEAAQRRIDELYEQVAKLEQENKRLKEGK
jgi:hypothetical protein